MSSCSSGLPFSVCTMISSKVLVLTVWNHLSNSVVTHGVRALLPWPSWRGKNPHPPPPPPRKKKNNNDNWKENLNVFLPLRLHYRRLTFFLGDVPQGTGVRGVTSPQSYFCVVMRSSRNGFSCTESLCTARQGPHYVHSS